MIGKTRDVVSLTNTCFLIVLLYVGIEQMGIGVTDRRVEDEHLDLIEKRILNRVGQLEETKYLLENKLHKVEANEKGANLKEYHRHADSIRNEISKNNFYTEYLNGWLGHISSARKSSTINTFFFEYNQCLEYAG